MPPACSHYLKIADAFGVDVGDLLTARSTRWVMTEAEDAWLTRVGMRARLGRVARRKSQAALGARAGVSRVTVRSVERGDHPAAVTAYARLPTFSPYR